MWEGIQEACIANGSYVQVTIEMIKELRLVTGCGMAKCREALEATNGDLRAAETYIRTGKIIVK